MMIVTHEMKFAKDVSTRIFYMDEGGIYEDGPPEQIFNNPRKERTRAFVKRLKTFEREIKSSTFDFIEVSTGIEEFGRKQLLSQRQINNLQLVFEELCVQTLLCRGKEVFPLRFSASVSELDGSCEATIFYNGPSYDPFIEQGNELSIRMVLGLTKEHAWNGENGNHITLTL
jgi:polar amino acid transport system ATP-binding protein